ncbi:RNA polymerase III RPC4-domain-containing protein [Podospora australis]|uniref:RNA polymerase III RPC4-domain-containing protein n=1 Tax=Podospora australis TaxID=1536484 RepID=A0AAN6X440_9PEZI|nr:RNA polymerase III RPC4-domain-containing protein [Podospora australis]
MPPKANPRGRGRGRGGASRGGAASNVTATSTPSEQPAPADASTVIDPSLSISESPATVSTPVQPTPTPTTTPATRGTASTGRAKFKPKGIRRSEAERARINEEQNRILQKKDDAEAKRLARLNRGRGRGRGRGGFMRAKPSMPAAGPFSGGISYGESGSGSASHQGPNLFKSEYYNGARDNRINADTLYMNPRRNDDEEGPLTSTKIKPIMPMGIRRIEHMDEATKSSNKSEKDEEENSDEDSLFVTDGKKSDRAPKTSSGSKTRIKKEGSGDAMELDISQIPEGYKGGEEAPEQEGRRIDISRNTVPDEDDAETTAIAEDLSRMLHLFTHHSDIADRGDESESQNSSLEGHMFLFQFPKTIAPLRPAGRDGDSEMPVKPEPTDDDDVVMLDTPKKRTNIDLTKEDQKGVKTEGDGDELFVSDNEEKDMTGDGGFVGNLIVRKSGKVELDWGGQTLLVAPGIPAHFLSTAVLMEQADNKDLQPGQPSQSGNRGLVYGMGTIQGSFTVSPVWKRMPEWVVDPKDLEIPEA